MNNMVSKPITVRQLKTLCDKEILKGNGDRVIMISDDDEGNGYHYLWYSFQTVEEMEAPCEYQGKTYQFPFEYADERVAPKDKTIILG
jgi:hypothetical protein